MTAQLQLVLTTLHIRCMIETCGKICLSCEFGKIVHFIDVYILKYGIVRLLQAAHLLFLTCH